MHVFLVKAAKLVREHDKLKQIPVILTTNYDTCSSARSRNRTEPEPYDLIT